MVFEKEVSRILDVAPANHRHRQLFGRRDVGHTFSLAVQTATQRETLSGFLKHGVRVARMSLR